MSLLRLIPAQISLLLLAALFMRMGIPLILIVPLTVLAMLGVLVPWPETRTAMAVLLGIGALVWGVMTWVRVQGRLAYEEPWVRLACILGGVALFTAWSGWLLRAPRRAGTSA